MTLEARIIKIISKECGIINLDDIKPESRLQDLDVDSLEMVMISMMIETEFGCQLNDEAFGEIKTVQQVIDHVRGVVA